MCVSPLRMRIALQLEYDGRHFCGWQSQAGGCGLQGINAAMKVLESAGIVECDGAAIIGSHPDVRKPQRVMAAAQIAKVIAQRIADRGKGDVLPGHLDFAEQLHLQALEAGCKVE